MSIHKSPLLAKPTPVNYQFESDNLLSPPEAGEGEVGAVRGSPPGIVARVPVKEGASQHTGIALLIARGGPLEGTFPRGSVSLEGGLPPSQLMQVLVSDIRL